MESESDPNLSRTSPNVLQSACNHSPRRRPHPASHKRWFLSLILITSCLISIADSQVNDSSSPEIAKSCSCMKYWQCISSGGVPHSYCGINQICCMDPPNPSSSSSSSRSVVSSSESVDLLLDPNDTEALILSSMMDNLNRARKVSTCGLKGTNSGREGVSEAGEWGWHTAILEKNQDLYVCGASLLDEFWVLTAAHCVDDYRDASRLKIRVGEHDVSSLKEPIRHAEYDVQRIFVHPQFNNNTLVNDIALLRLGQAVRKTDNVNIVCLPDNETFASHTELSQTKCFITGWGRSSENSSDSDHSLVLKEVLLPIWESNRCQAMLRRQFGKSYVLPKSNLCAGAEGRDACDGDGGGPLVCEKRGVWYQVGIVSFGIGCGRRNIPGVYTRVSWYTDWIYGTAVAASRVT